MMSVMTKDINYRTILLSTFNISLNQTELEARNESVRILMHDYTVQLSYQSPQTDRLSSGSLWAGSRSPCEL